MFPAWRLQLREARLAVADGRWDEAAAMLSGSLREFLPAKRLSQELAEQLVARAQQRIDVGHSSAGWRDLDRALQLGAGETTVGEIRRQQADRRLRQAMEYLARGDAATARQSLERMKDRRLGGERRAVWQSVAQRAENAAARAARGDMASAIAELEAAQRLLPADDPAGVGSCLERQMTGLHETAAKLHPLDAELHAALAAGDWTETLRLAELLLELAPQHSAARQARHKAWQRVGMEVTLPYHPAAARRVLWSRQPLGVGDRSVFSTQRYARNGDIDTVINQRTPGKRVVAWIDEVGGFLLCLGEEIVLGQPSADGGVDVPILADISRRHAVIRREREAYVLIPHHRTLVDTRVVEEPTVLRDDSSIKLGDAVELKFRKPHALSATAVLRIVSHHRTEPAVDGIVLMGESCILGPQSHSHVRCRDWTGELVLFRRSGELMCRTQQPIEIDGQSCVGQAAVCGDCRIESDEFALSLEEI